MKRPDELDKSSSIYLFKEEIKPVWEDPHNQGGGSLVLKFQKDKCNRIWENVLIALIRSTPEQVKKINGVRIKIRKDNAEIDVWVAQTHSEEELNAQRQWVLKATSLHQDTTLEVINFDN